MLSCLRTILARDVAALASASAPASVLSSPRYCLASRPALASRRARVRCPTPRPAHRPAPRRPRPSGPTPSRLRKRILAPDAAKPNGARTHLLLPSAAGSATAIADRSEQTQTIAAQTAA